MNQSELQGTLNNLKNSGQFKRKLKLFLGIGCLGFLLIGGLIIWAGVTTVKHVATLGKNVNVQGQIEDLKGNIGKIPAIAKVGCWEKVQSLMNIQVWLEAPLVENITSLKDACLGPEIKEKPEPGA